MDGVRKVDLAEALGRVDEYWSPRIVGAVNDTDVKVVKLRGAFQWHRHEAEDELFLVVAGRLTIRFRDRDVTLTAGELLVVPRGVEHLPVAEEEAHVVLVEPRSTVNTGDAPSERTVAARWLGPGGGA
jgi:mannose-6-phosphate isomerase-like protein (cupin superfamily)